MNTPKQMLGPDDKCVDNWSIVNRVRPEDRQLVWLYKDEELFWDELVTVSEASDKKVLYYCAGEDQHSHRVPRAARRKEGYDLVLND
ncbi:hypothetical protein IFT90_15855 [Frigoribacterium sp. CFBP 8766]|uniref:hypothetical protein n=1 Tax=unclassified Frigoribacterium TaxID=2627005 RepID=UPI00177F9EB4|nr:MULTISPECIES: hypothetical protein [unclassified Frigoribacterium]MBD8586031.1 hypothetical protein [Frigoribacterium sp. CFBP 8766]MBD8728992.1 hypothetical protein [Frigoribacterium sp. CFBP 13707]